MDITTTDSVSIDVQRDPVLLRFGDAVREAYAGRLERVLLYGSRARGNAREDSDYDIAVFLSDMPDRPSEMNRLADIGTDILYIAGHVVHAMPHPALAYLDDTSLMRAIRRDGIDL